jgi:hypothetical protein
MIMLEILAGSLVIAWLTHGLLLIWFQGSLFSRMRGWLEPRHDLHWWAKLLTCSLCLTTHVVLLEVLLLLPWYAKTHALFELFLLPFFWGGGFTIARAIDRVWSVNPAEE